MTKDKSLNLLCDFNKFNLIMKLVYHKETHSK